MPTIYKTKIDHTDHKWAVKQNVRKDTRISGIPDRDALVYYDLWCMDCHKPVGRLNHDEAWKLYSSGVEFINLTTKVKNSRYKKLQRGK